VVIFIVVVVLLVVAVVVVLVAHAAGTYMPLGQHGQPAHIGKQHDSSKPPRNFSQNGSHGRVVVVVLVVVIVDEVVVVLVVVKVPLLLVVVVVPGSQYNTIPVRGFAFRKGVTETP